MQNLIIRNLIIEISTIFKYIETFLEGNDMNLSFNISRLIRKYNKFVEILFGQYSVQQKLYLFEARSSNHCSWLGTYISAGMRSNPGDSGDPRSFVLLAETLNIKRRKKLNANLFFYIFTFARFVSMKVFVIIQWIDSYFNKKSKYTFAVWIMIDDSSFYKYKKVFTEFSLI